MKTAASTFAGLFLVLAGATTTARAGGAAFTDIGAGLTGLYSAEMAWGDYDNDGDLDIAVVGYTIAGPISRIYRNTAGAFADVGALPVAVSNGALAWGDYDNDGDLDLAIAGDTGGGLITRIYRNTAGTFTDIGAAIAAEGVRDCALGWGDYDNDGDIDLAVTGSIAGSVSKAHLYRNNIGSGTFTDLGAVFTAVRYASLGWADYDLDGDLDLLTGGYGTSSEVTTLHRNTGGVLSAVASGLPDMSSGAFGWGDYDNDGDPDVILSEPGIAGVYRNDAGSFVNAGFGIQQTENPATEWGDYDNDGRRDLALGGTTGSVGFGAVYHNNNPGFSDISAVLPQLYDAAFAWGDYDNDGDIDLMAAGSDDRGSIFPVHRIYQLTGVPANAPPAAPTGLSVTTTATTVTFHWNGATDPQGGAAGLTYNLWAGTAPGTANVMSPMANLASGLRRVAQGGNVGQGHQWTLQKSAFAGNHVYWGVQAIDQAFAGSPFANGPSGTLDVGDGVAASVLRVRLAGANPSHGDARLVYTLPRAGHVELAVLDVSGRRARTLVAGERAAGAHEASWDGTAEDGRRAAPGLYLARVSAGGQTSATRIVRLE